MNLTRMFCVFYLLGLGTQINAAPALKMHVFDEVTAPKNNAKPQDKDELQKPELTTHIFILNSNEADIPENAKTSQPPTKTFPLRYERAEFYFKTGFREDELFWNKAGLGGQPNILSELSWDNLFILTANIGTTLYFGEHWLGNVDLLFGQIKSGDNQDSDYLGDNRTEEFSRSNNSTDDGDVLDISAHAGYRWYWPESKSNSWQSELRSLFGVSYHQQNLIIQDGFQTIPAFGAFEGLDSQYKTTWYGPWVGLEGRWQDSERFQLKFVVQYHYAFYDASATWNLRSDFAQPESFTHKAEGYGWIYELEGLYRLTPKLAINLTLKKQDWRADRNGEDKTYFANGNTVKLKFNEVEWESFGASLGLEYVF